MSTNATPRKHALLIGIDAYPKLNPLDGCANDVRLVRSVLQERYGFPDEGITQLLDEEATRDAMLQALDALVERVGTDDIVVIQYAGHGCQMTDREGDEPDGLDETLMPWDSEGGQGDNRDITDDEIHLRLVELAKKTPYTTLIIDACHSGTITRDGFGGKARTMPADRRPVDQLPPSPIPPDKRGAVRGRGPSGWMPLQDAYVLMAGCRDEEVSYEYQAEVGGEVEPHGAMTWFLCQELLSAPAGATYRDVFERVAAKVNAANDRQHPQMEGRVDREVFGIRDRVPTPFVRVLSRTGDRVVLAAGALHDATVGSRYQVHPQGTHAPSDETALGMVEVTAVRAVECDARVVEGGDDPAFTADARAVETLHVFGPFQLSLDVVDRSGVEGALPEVKASLESSGLLRVLDEGDARASVRVYLLPARDGATEDDPVPQAGALAEPTLAVVDGAGGRLTPLHPLGDLAIVRENLETIARYRHLLALENPDPRSRLRDRFRLELLRHDAEGAWVVAGPEEAGGLVVYEEDEPIAFRIISDHDEAAWFSLGDFGLSGRFAQLEQGRLDADVAFELWTRPDEDPARVSIPDQFPPEVTEGIGAVKLFLATKPIDLEAREQAGVRDAGGSVVDEILGGALAGSTRDVKRPSGAKDDWATVVRPFIVRRRTGTDLAPEGHTLDLGGVTLQTPGVSGTATARPGKSGRAEALAPTDAALSAALDEAAMSVQDTVVLRSPSAPPPGSRGAAADPHVAVTARAPQPGFSQAVLATDELGVMSWHFPEAPEPGARGDLVTYRIPFGAREDGTRGLAAQAVVVALKVLVFPRLEAVVGEAAQSAVSRWEDVHRPHRIRWFGPDDYTGADARVMDAEGWQTLSAGRALLFVHGTTSTAHGAFGDLPPTLMRDLHERYGGRIFALDHPTVSRDPRENAAWFVEQIPAGLHLDVDIVCHSRGGLVSRILAERQAELPLGDRTMDVGRVVFVGSPNAGTKLADGLSTGAFLDTYTNLVCKLPGGAAAQSLQVLLVVVKQLAAQAQAGLEGLRSMVPGGDFNRWLNDGKGRTEATYHALASAFKATDRRLVRLGNTCVLDRLFQEDHDLVVPAASVHAANGAATFPVADPVVFAGAEAMTHVAYFGSPAVRDRLLEWLTG